MPSLVKPRNQHRAFDCPKLSLSLPRVLNIKIQENSQILFRKILKNKWYHAKELPKRFYLNGYTIGFCLQTQTLQLDDTVVSIIDCCSERFQIHSGPLLRLVLLGSQSTLVTWLKLVRVFCFKKENIILKIYCLCSRSTVVH